MRWRHGAPRWSTGERREPPGESSRARSSEFYLGGLLGSLGRREVGLLLETEHLGGDVPGKAAKHRVVTLRHLVVAPPLHCDAVLRPLELRLEFEEILVRLELGIVLGD